MELDIKHCQIKHPANSLIVGMSGSGKTQLLRRILKNFKILFTNLNKDKITVLWGYGQIHSLIDIKINDDIKTIYIEGIPTEDMITETQPNVIVIDDLLHEMSKDNKFENIFIKKSHHLNISVFFLVQNLFYHAKAMRTVSLNSHYIYLLKNPRDQTQVMSLARQIYPSNTKYFIQSFNNATDKAYGYIRVDLTPDTPENLRIMSRLTPEENNGIFSPIVYLPKDIIAS